MRRNRCAKWIWPWSEDFVISILGFPICCGANFQQPIANPSIEITKSSLHRDLKGWPKGDRPVERAFLYRNTGFPDFVGCNFPPADREPQYRDNEVLAPR